MKQLYPGLPFVYDDNGYIVGLRNADSTTLYFLQSLSDATTPVNGVKATLTSDMTNANADLTFTAVDYGTAGNDITLTYVDPAGNNKALAVTVTGSAISVSQATGAGGAITSTANAVKAAIDASTAAAALVTVAVEGTGLGVVNAKTVAPLTGGITVTPGPVGCLAYSSAGVLYRKTAAQTWAPVTGALAGTNGSSAAVNVKLIYEAGVLGVEEI